MVAALGRRGVPAAPLSRAFEWLPAATTVFVLYLLVLAKGGVVDSARALAVGVAAAALLVHGGARLLGGAPFDRWERAWLPVWLALSALLLLQLLPLPPSLLYHLGPYPAALFDGAVRPPLTRLSPAPGATLGYWSMFTLYWLVAYWVATLKRDKLLVVVVALVAVAAFEAVYGFLAFAGKHRTVLGLWTLGHSTGGTSHDVVRGTFGNRNHMAGFLAVCWPLAIGLLLYGVSSSRRVQAGELRYFVLIVFSVALALALLNTGSRLGVVAGMLGLLGYYLCAKYSGGGHSSRQQRLWLWTAGALALLAALWVGLVPLLSRYSILLLGEEVKRLEVWQTVFQLPAKVWLLGIGAGGFEETFKLVQPVSVFESYAHLHNDWLQFVLEFGLLGTALVVAALVLWFRRVKPAKLTQLQAAACGSITAIALHSLGDFNLQIPGVAMAFWIAVGVAFNRELSAAASARRRSRRERARPRTDAETSR